MRFGGARRPVARRFMCRQRERGVDNMVDTAKAADLLIAARRDGDIVALEELPQTLDEAYAIQNAIIGRIGVPVVGWKAAFTNEGAMQKMKTTEPAMGPLFEPWVVQSGASLATPDDCLRRGAS